MFRRHRNISRPENPENLIHQPRNVTYDWTNLPTH
jgi:hypothetical protein